MFQNLDFIQMFFMNLIVMGVWHATTFILSVKLPPSFFNPDSFQYRPRKWERGGRWYKDVLKINIWKDRAPQFVAKDGGFSKQHLQDLSSEYLDRFIAETCRAEWMHTLNMLNIIALVLLNLSFAGVAISVPVFLGNAPFAIIQRYNRHRLLVLRKRKTRVTARKSV